MKYLILISAAFLTINAQAGDQPGNEEVPNAKERYEPSSQYSPFPGFPRTHLVKEGDGTAEPAAALIVDPDLSQKIARKYFTSLQVRDLSIKPKDAHAVGTVLHFPFAVSLKHTSGTFSQGTVEVAGDIMVIQEGNRVRVEVEKFYDSQRAERLGRFLGLNDGIDLTTARKIVVPVLESFFNENPARVKTLFDLVPTMSLPGKT